MSTVQTASILISDPDSSIRQEQGEILRADGWMVAETGGGEELFEAALERPALLLMAAELLGGDPEARLGELRERAGEGLRVVLTFDADLELDWEACSRAGVDEFVERHAPAWILRHRIRRLMPVEASAAEQAGSWMEPDVFAAKLRARLGTAAGDESQVAVLAAVLDIHGMDLGQLSSSAGKSLTQELGRRMRAAFEDGEDGGTLSGLLQGMRLARIEPGVVMMMIPGVRRVQDTARIGARLQERMAQPLEVDGKTRDPLVGLGVAAFPEDGQDASILMQNALTAARRARNEGTSLMIFHTEAMGRWAFERLTLERSLREAIVREELRVYYQPRVDAETRRILGMECLVRWQHPELGLVPPVQFIPLAEETGLIVPIGEWVLREACRQNQEWREKGLPEIAVSVNLSPVQFRVGDLVEVVNDALRESGLDQGGLELEVTESMLMNDPKKTVEILERLKGAGIHISIDDFGTGYSSLSYLKRFPIDALKIDRSFVMNVTTDPDDAAIATAIILMGHSLKLSVVAEGVETESQLEFLRVLQCNEIQGYLFSPPVPADRAEELLRAQKAGVQAA